VKRRAREARGVDNPPAQGRFRGTYRWLRRSPERVAVEPGPAPTASLEIEAIVGEIMVIAPPPTGASPVEPPPAREWNVWDLERRAREQAGDAARDEEWAALFMHLRPFANADGVLPLQFDGLVRESFSELIQTT